MLFLLFVETKSLSCFCRRWTCDGSVTQEQTRVLTDVVRLAWVEHRQPRREGDGIWHQNDELLCHVPAHVAHRQPDAEPEEPEEQRVDLLQVSSEETTLVGISITLTFRALAPLRERETRLIPPTVYSRLFEFPTTFDIQSTTRKSHCHGYSRRLPALVLNHFDNQCSTCLSPPKTQV